MHVAGSDRHHRSERAAHDHVACLERVADFDHGSREPQRRVQRMAEAGRASADRHRLAAALHHHAAQAQIEPVELARLGAEHIQAGRCVVGDGVEQLDVPVLDAAADDLDRGQRISDRADEIADRHAGMHQIAMQHERDLGLDLRLQHFAQARLPRRRRAPCRRTTCRSPASPRRAASVPTSMSSPILRPTRRRPSLRQCSVFACCTAYAAATPPSARSSRIGAIGLPSSAAWRSRAAAA